MSSIENRALWGSKLGFILAASGSAVGLGNIWRFPYIAQENGGGIFLFVYLLAILFIGLPIILAEFALGRATAQNAVGAYRAISKRWAFLGYWAVFVCFGVLAYFYVISGWTLAYMAKAVTGDLTSAPFKDFLADPKSQIFYTVIFALLPITVVAFGVRKGIERMAEVLLPLFVVLLVGMFVHSLLKLGSNEGLRYLFTPDVSKLNAKTALFAVGQAFFSLSIGMGVMITYGSYQRKSDNLMTSSIAVTAFNTLVAILAASLIFAIAGHSLERGGPSLMFETMIKLFAAPEYGRVIPILFFAMLAIAALTTSVSFLETLVSYSIDELKISRKYAVFAVTAAVLALSVPSALSMGANETLSNIWNGKGFLWVIDILFGNVLLTVGGLLMCVFVTWRWGIWLAGREVLVGSPGFGKLIRLWRITLGFIAPAAIITLIVYIIWHESHSVFWQF